MELLGSKYLETERLILRKTEEEDLKKLWKILCDRDISRYYLTCKINDNWEDEKKWQYKKLEKASNPDVFCWTIVRKDNNERKAAVRCSRQWPGASECCRPD